MVSNIVLSVMAWGSTLRTAFMTRLREENGQDVLEYAVLVGAIAIVAGAALYASPLSFGTFVNKIQACVSFDGANCK